jgi:hypothetical protein
VCRNGYIRCDPRSGKRFSTRLQESSTVGESTVGDTALGLREHALSPPAPVPPHVAHQGADAIGPVGPMPTYRVHDQDAETGTESAAARICRMSLSATLCASVPLLAFAVRAKMSAAFVGVS